MDIMAMANMLEIVNPTQYSADALENIVTFKVQKLIIYASLTRIEMCQVHNLIPAEKAALIHI